jgi:hypothetical protein
MRQLASPEKKARDNRRVQSHEVDHQTSEVIGADGAHDGALRDTWQEASKAWTPPREIPGNALAIETVTPQIMSIELRPNDLASPRILASD